MKRPFAILPLIGAIFFVSSATIQAQKPANVGVSVDANDLFDYDKSIPLSVEAGAPAETPAGIMTKLTYLSINNLRVPAIFVAPKGSEGKKLPAIIVMHGLGQEKMGLSMLFGNFTKAGYCLIAIDAQYHGERVSKPAIELFGANAYATRNMMIQTVVDLRRAVDYLETRPEVDPKRIGYIGFSMGGMLGTITSAVEPRIHAPILALAGGDFKLMFSLSKLPSATRAKTVADLDTTTAIRVMNPVDPINYVARISPRPVLFINGDADSIVPVPCAKKLQDAAGPGKEIFMYKGEHVPAGVEMFKVLAKVNQWFDAHFKAAN